MKILSLAFIAGAAFAVAPAMPVSAQSSDAKEALAKLDQDHDGTLSVKEVKQAARKHFRALDPDADGTLDAKEAAVAGITPDELAKADPDKDGTLDEKEFVAIAVARFKVANKDTDKTIDAAELDSPAGQALLKLLQ